MSTEAILDKRFVALPELIRDATNQNSTALDVRRFMDNLVAPDPALFSGALQFLSRDEQGYVLVRQIGDAIDNARSWSRWPLRRLFATRRPSLITNPVSGQCALAVPLIVGSARHVIVAPLRAQILTAAQQVFLDTLQSVSAPPATVSTADERIPRFAWLGASARIGERLETLALRRAWPLVSVPTFGHVMVMLEHDDVDIVLLEARALQEQLSSLRALRHAVKIGDAPIVYFTDCEPGPEVRTLVDCCLFTNAGEAELLNALKGSAALVSRTRGHVLRANVERFEPQLRSCADLGALAQTCAEAALLLGVDVVSVMLADMGEVRAAHVPDGTLLSDQWPTSFMTGEIITRSRAGDAFFEEAFDNPEYVRYLRGLDAVSAAALPIADGTQIVGSLVAVSTSRAMFQPEFDALRDLCERTARIAVMLRKRPAFAAPWRTVNLGDAMLEAFEGGQARASVCVRTNEHYGAIVILERKDDRRACMLAESLLLAPQADLREMLLQCKDQARGILLAVVEDDERMRFACEGLPTPLRVPISGPVLAGERADACQTGTLSLDAPGITLLYSNAFAAQVAPAQLVRVVQQALREGRAAVARSLAGLAVNAQQLAFACVTTPSNGAARQHPQLSV